ncbi:hypothetical protein O1M54_04740 [Streptomyces diastatochromogenes]|nr:hypothetical protein [Streptomyces diastatochromogenes]
MPTGVEWHDGTLRVRFTAEYTDADGPLTVRPDGPRPSADGAPADLAEAVSWLATAAADGFEKATLDLVLRDRETAASFFQPVEVTRERVAAGDGRTRLVLRGTATVDPPRRRTAPAARRAVGRLRPGRARRLDQGVPAGPRTGRAPHAAARRDPRAPGRAAVLDEAARQPLPGRGPRLQGPGPDRAHPADATVSPTTC